MTKKKCIVCGKEFIGRNNSRYCSDECRNTPIYTDKFNGETHGQLKIINAYRKKSTVYAICECKCGNICTVRYDCLLSGNNISCGCVNKQHNQTKPVELTGKVNQYGCMAIKYLGIGKEGADWLCQCHCGKEFKVPAGRFYKTKSCGCAKIESRKEAIEKANEQFGSLANYTGMGGIDKMIGVPTSEDDRCIYPDSDVEFDDVLPFTE